MPERIHLTVDGRVLEAEPDQSVLAALWNARTRALRTSAAGDARGALCGMGTCFECRVTIDGVPHVRSCRAPVRDGMVVTTRG